ncbi:uncharacterized protein TrAFT101_011542 [Trichoderma asperellum]|uniref:uncharacterized protein n=1 Tax=Trichoderma asperellum TaxID=101201 RepID=UPI00332F5F70|nr:hypothetical protein TrAFT101_011542 [Trichoderma asperellum]
MWATSQRKCIFWLNGMAGTGKSTISRTLAKRFLDQKILGASFFFKRGEADRGNAKQFFSTLASQLQTRIPGMVDYLREVIDAEPQISAKSLKEQFERLILEPISRLKPSSSQPSILVIVIDALDECENDRDIRVILHLLPQVQECSSTRLQVFVTSRPELPIRLGFDAMGGNDYQDLILHQIPRADIQHDIRLFLEYKLADIRKIRSLPQDWPGITEITTLVTMSVPLFIYAATVCRVLEDHNLDPRQSLDDYFSYKAEESTLDAIYLPVLNRIGAKYNDNSRRKDQLIQDVKEVVSAIILLESPLSVFSLSKFIDLPTMAIKARLSSLHSVLHIPDDETVPIRLFHLSFRDFLLDPKTPGKTAIWTDKKATHEKLALRCLSVMDTSLQKNICNLASPAIHRHHNITAKTVNQCIPIQLQYSCRYWAHHLMKSQDLTTQLKRAQYFLETKFLYWVEAMSILGILPEVTEILRKLQSIIKHESNSEMSKLLHDAIRFILRNQTMINTTPLQLYVSGLLFAPATSEIKRLFSANLPDWISMPHTNENSWGAELGTLDCSDSVDDHCIAFSPNGLLLAAGAHDGTIQLWNAVTGNSLQKLDSECDFIRAIVFSPDSDLLISCSGSIADFESTTGKLQFWDTTTGTLQSTLDEDVGDVTSLVFTDGDRLLASPSMSWDFLSWDRSNGVQKHMLSERLTEDMTTVFSLNGLLLASHCFDKNIDIWNVRTGNLQQTLVGYGDVVCAAFSPNGQILASIDEDGIITLWDTTTGVQQQHIMRSVGQAGNIRFSPNGQLLASSHGNPGRPERDMDGTIGLWDLNSCNLVRTLKVNQGAVYSTYFSPDGETLVSVSKNGKNGRFIKLWDATDISPIQMPQPPYSRARALSKLLASVYNTSTIREATEIYPTQTPHPSYSRAMAFSLDGQLLASVCGTGTIVIWDVTNETVVRKLRDQCGTDPVEVLTFSPDGALLACSSDAGSIGVWDVIKDTKRHSIKGHSKTHGVAFSPDSLLMACSDSDNIIRLWDLTTRNLQQVLNIQSYSYSLSFSPNGRLLALCPYDSHPSYPTELRKIEIWDHSTGHLLHASAWKLNEIYLDQELSRRECDFSALKLWNPETGSINECLEVVTPLDYSSSSKSNNKWTRQLKWIHDSNLYTQSKWIIEIDDHAEWISYHGTRVLCIPPNHHTYCWAMSNNTIALGHYSGSVTFIKFSPQIEP